MNDKPLFIPLKAKFFDQFKAGTKDAEYRKGGPRWNAKTCWVGRAVVLSKGYGKAERLTGRVVRFSYHLNPASIPGWLECYGPDAGLAACIKIELDPR